MSEPPCQVLWPSGSQDLALLAEPERRPLPFLEGVHAHLGSRQLLDVSCEDACLVGEPDWLDAVAEAELRGERGREANSPL